VLSKPFISPEFRVRTPKGGKLRSRGKERKRAMGAPLIAVS
jgi:hypothetical protein